MTYNGCFADGVHFVYRRHFAYLGIANEEWDYAECMDDGPAQSQENPWRERHDADDTEARTAAIDIWNALPERTRAWYELIAVLPFENILDIDEKGGEYLAYPHIYTIELVRERGPFRWFLQSLETSDRWDARSAIPDDSKRIEKFPRSDNCNNFANGLKK